LKMAIQPEISRVKETHKEALMAKPNVIGVGTGYKVSEGKRTEELCLVTLVRQKMPPSALQAEAMVPKEIEGIRTDVVEIGDVRALQTHTSRWRPAPAGVSLGHYRITAGTFGCLVRDRASGAPLMLSNNHVLANSNDAAVGDAILQPGPADGGRLGADTIAVLERFCPIEFNNQPGSCNVAGAYASVGNAIARLLGSQHRVVTIKANPQAVNLADAAVARPNLDSDLLDEILEVGRISGTLPAELGMAVRKSGRTTGLTSGEITVMEATVTVSYGTGKDARFENQLIMGPMSQGGDSGSLIVAAGSLQAVGLLFAGSEQSTIANPIQAVMNCLDVTL
jgi:hypothetical protein